MRKLLIAVVLLAQAAGAGTMISRNDSAYYGGVGPMGEVIQWTQANTYMNVDISVSLWDISPGGPMAGTQAQFYLMSNVGPGTTVADQIAISAVSGLSGTPSSTLIFSGLTLGPGTYYLQMVRNSDYISGVYSKPAPLIAAAGISNVLENVLQTGNAYPPANAFNATWAAPTLLFNITGDLPAGNATPEPGSLAMAAAGLLAATGYGLRRRGNPDSRNR